MTEIPILIVASAAIACQMLILRYLHKELRERDTVIRRLLDRLVAWEASEKDPFIGRMLAQAPMSLKEEVVEHHRPAPKPSPKKAQEPAKEVKARHYM